MDSDLTGWIKESWDKTLKAWKKEKNTKDLFNLSRTLRLFINEVRDKKYGLSPEH